MKLFVKPVIDERTRENSRHAAGIVLGVTQVMLAGVIFFRLYVLGQADEQLRDFQAVLGVSIFGFIALQLYLGGLLPALTTWGALIAYAALAALVSGGCLLIYGLPPIEDWTSTWLPSLLGPAALVGLYYLIARLGRRRVERMIQEQE